jgi:hypothetical protein
MSICPTCASDYTKIVESRLCTNGTRRRRHRCDNCRHIWTTWDGPRPPRGGIGTRNPPQYQRSWKCKLSTEQVRYALVSIDLSNAQVARELDCSTETIRQIRNGTIYRYEHPELLRTKATAKSPPPAPLPDGPNCLECTHWKGAECGFGFPDPVLEGVTFAADCDLYERVSQSISRA